MRFIIKWSKLNIKRSIVRIEDWNIMNKQTLRVSKVATWRSFMRRQTSRHKWSMMGRESISLVVM